MPTGGKNGYAQDRGAAIEAANSLAGDLLEKLALQQRQESGESGLSGKWGQDIGGGENVQQDIERLTKELRHSIAEAVVFIDAPHPDVAGALLSRQFTNAETAKQRRDDLMIGVALILAGGPVAAGLRSFAMQAASRLGASAGSAELIGTATGLSAGAATALASMTDAWRSARRDVLNDALAKTGTNTNDPAEVHAILTKNPDLLDHIAKETTRATFANFLGGRFGGMAGNGVKATTGVNDWAVSIIEEAVSSTAERGLNTMVSK